MSAQHCRLADGGLIHRDQPLSFSFDGRRMNGYAGDTVASALLANGVDLIARSFKYHRRRGIFAAGQEDPNAIITLGEDAHAEPNLFAGRILLREGLTLHSQNRWPCLQHDIGALSALVSPLLPAGFYYKTFKWPGWAWHYYERAIRNAAGFGESPTRPDPDIYDKQYLHCDLLVVGAGPAGLMAARTAAADGARVVVCDDGSLPGGALLNEQITLDGLSGVDWSRRMTAELDATRNVAVYRQTTVTGFYDHNYLIAVRTNPEPITTSLPRPPRQSLLKIRATQVVLATGAIERSLLFAGNDRPGVMLASGVRAYINRYAVKPGSTAVLYVNNDSGYATVTALKKAGISVRAVVDLRETPAEAALAIAKFHGVQVHTGHRIQQTLGYKHIRAVDVTPVAASGGFRLSCDLLCVAGGWTPNTQLFSQAGGTLHFDTLMSTLVADADTHSARLSGSAAALFDTKACLESGRRAAAESLGSTTTAALPEIDEQALPQTLVRLDWEHAVSSNLCNKIFVDLQNDVTVADLALAAREGYASVELAKRYTATGMGTDQGRTSNVHALGLLSVITGQKPQDLGHTTYRAPCTPITLGAVAGRDLGTTLAPIRHTPFHHLHLDTAVVFEPSSSWLYPKYYDRDGETMEAAIEREIVNVRTNVGVVDMSTLARIEVRGPDAVEFIERVFVNKFTKLPVNRCRYAIMLRTDGMVLDDGMVTRLGEDHFLISTTTAQCWVVQLHLQRLLEIDFPDLDLWLQPLTDQWASLAIAGPMARAVLQGLEPDFAISNKEFAFLDFREGTAAGLPVRIFRVSFSGELSYEINVAADYAEPLWQAVFKAGAQFGIMPYGLEALDVLRIEKGHLAVGTEIDGNTTADDLGLGRMVKTDRFFIGSSLLKRPALQRQDRLQLVGLSPVDGSSPIPRGAQIIQERFNGVTTDALGHVTATVYSPTLDRPIALALVSGGRDRMGEQLVASSPAMSQETLVTVTDAVSVDIQGKRLRQ